MLRKLSYGVCSIQRVNKLSLYYFVFNFCSSQCCVWVAPCSYSWSSTLFLSCSRLSFQYQSSCHKHKQVRLSPLENWETHPPNYLKVSKAINISGDGWIPSVHSSLWCSPLSPPSLPARPKLVLTPIQWPWCKWGIAWSGIIKKGWDKNREIQCLACSCQISV